MRFAFYMNCVSAHQLPLAEEIAKAVGNENFIYVDAEGSGQPLQTVTDAQCVNIKRLSEVCYDFVKNCDVHITVVRDVGLFEHRARNGLRTFYTSERWFKPPFGMLRLFHPHYFKMACRLVGLIRREPAFIYLPIGIHAAMDMARLCGLMHGDLRCLFRVPELEFERKPGGGIWLAQGRRGAEEKRRYCLDKMRMWGYFVEPSEFACQGAQTENADDNSKLSTHNSKLKTLHVLWVGRLLDWKRVDTIIRAVGELSKRSTCSTRLKIQLDLYGTGPEEIRLKKLASNYADSIRFYPPVPIHEVRKVMREHDVYVLASNAYEGWGAVVSEALEEGMKVIGTYEAGSSATILPESNLFHAGDWKALLKLLQNGVPNIGVGKWSAKEAAGQILSFCKKESGIEG